MTGSDIKGKCKECKYFSNEGVHLGVCKRYPNVVNKHYNDWCGEYDIREVVENFAQLSEAMPELAKAAEALVTISVEPKKRGRKPSAKTQTA